MGLEFPTRVTQFCEINSGENFLLFGIARGKVRNCRVIFRNGCPQPSCLNKLHENKANKKTSKKYVFFKPIPTVVNQCLIKDI